VPEHLWRGGHPHAVGVVDAVSARERRVNERHGLQPDVGPPSTSSEIYVVIEELAESEMLSKARHLDQPGVGNGMVVVETHLDPVQGVRR